MNESIYQATFENGLPFKSEETLIIKNERIDALQGTLDKIYERRLIRLPSLIIIDGGSGQGKSTIAIEVLEYFNKKQELPIIECNLKGNQYSKGGKEFTKKIKLASEEGFCSMAYDEAGDFNRKTTLSRFNRNLDMVFNQFRVYDIIVVLIVQSVGYIENDLFTKGVVRMLINCYGRKGIIKSNYRCYELDRINYLRQAIKKEVTPIKAYQKVSANIYGQFYNISTKRDQELHEVGYKKKDEDISQGDINLDGLIDYETISHKIGLSLFTTKLKINKLKIKPERFYKKKAYFKQNIINILK